MNYYRILQLNKTASILEVKKAYRRLSLIHHPDKPSGSNDEFHKISIAYDILSDENKKRLYDYGLNKFGYMTELNCLLLPKIFIDYYSNNRFSIREFILHLYNNHKMTNEIKLIKELLVKYKLKNISNSIKPVLLDISLQDYINNIKHEITVENICHKCFGKTTINECRICKKTDEFDIICNNFCDIDFIKIDCSECIHYTKFLTVYPKEKYTNISFNVLSNDDYKIVDNKHIYIDIEITLYKWLFGGEILYTYLNNKEYKIQLEGFVQNSDVTYILEKEGLNDGNIYLNFYVDFTEELQNKIKKL